MGVGAPPHTRAQGDARARAHRLAQRAWRLGGRRLEGAARARGGRRRSPGARRLGRDGERHTAAINPSLRSVATTRTEAERGRGRGMVLGRRARVAGLCLLAHAGLARELTGPMLQLTCDHTHTGKPCAAWGGRETAREGRCAAYAGEAVGWCWVDEGHSEWQFCEPACTGLGSAGAQWDMRDAVMFPSLNAAVSHLHRRGPDIDASIKLLSSAVAQARTDVQEYWEGDDVGPLANALCSATV